MESVDNSSDTDASYTKKTFKCTEQGCNASFSKNSRLIQHTRIHTGERPFACDQPECNKTYTRSAHLRRHKNVSHGEKETQSVICEHEGCGLVLANKYSLKKHYNRKHNLDNYEFVCPVCSQGFHRKKQLQQHSYLHTGEAPFSCSDCEMSFTTSYNLNKHKRSHRTYKCDCGETFKKWSLILSHKRLCRQPGFHCKVCDKQFSHLGNYKNHLLVHKEKTEKMVYVCPYNDCKRFYFYKKNLKYHIDNFHMKINDGKVYNCTYPKCKVVLKTKQSLKVHLQKQHFKCFKRKTRKLRHDKGTIKKPMASILSGETDSKFEENNVPVIENIVPENANLLENNLLCISEKISDELLLKQCDITLSLINEIMVTAR